MKSFLNGKLEYADNSTIYHSFKAKEWCKCVNDIEKQLNKAATWSREIQFSFYSKQNKSR